LHIDVAGAFAAVDVHGEASREEAAAKAADDNAWRTIDLTAFAAVGASAGEAPASTGAAAGSNTWRIVAAAAFVAADVQDDGSSTSEILGSSSTAASVSDALAAIAPSPPLLPLKSKIRLGPLCSAEAPPPFLHTYERELSRAAALRLLLLPMLLRSVRWLALRSVPVPVPLRYESWR
jgi:hypothetical protein